MSSGFWVEPANSKGVNIASQALILLLYIENMMIDITMSDNSQNTKTNQDIESSYMGKL